VRCCPALQLGTPAHATPYTSHRNASRAASTSWSEQLHPTRCGVRCTCLSTKRCCSLSSQQPSLSIMVLTRSSKRRSTSTGATQSRKKRRVAEAESDDDDQVAAVEEKSEEEEGINATDARWVHPHRPAEIVPRKQAHTQVAREERQVATEEAGNPVELRVGCRVGHVPHCQAGQENTQGVRLPLLLRRVESQDNVRACCGCFWQRTGRRRATAANLTIRPFLYASIGKRMNHFKNLKTLIVDEFGRTLKNSRKSNQDESFAVRSFCCAGRHTACGADVVQLDCAQLHDALAHAQGDG